MNSACVKEIGDATYPGTLAAGKRQAGEDLWFPTRPSNKGDAGQRHSSIAEAKEFLKAYLLIDNRRFTRKAAQTENLHRAAPQRIEPEQDSLHLDGKEGP